MTALATKTTPAELFATLDNYLTHFASDMATRVSRGLAPLFDPERNSLSQVVRDLTSCAMVPYPAQAVVVEAALRGLREKDVVWIVGEMGTGKTPLALWIVLCAMRTAKRPMRIIITAPNQLVKKWRKHCLDIIPDCPAHIIKSWRELRRLIESSTTIEKTIAADGEPSKQRSRRWLEPNKPEIWILPRDRGKLGYAWTPAVIVCERIYRIKGQAEPIRGLVYQCPRCGTIVSDEDNNYVTSDYFVTADGKPKKRRVCSVKTCREPLWQAYSGKASKFKHDTMPTPGISPRRMAPCAYLRAIGAHFDFYIADEVHELKGEGTLQGQMFADLALLSDKVLPLTGTLVGGYADNLLHLLWRTIAPRLVADGLQHDSAGFEQYVKLYGVLQTERRYVNNGHQSKRDLMQGRGKLVSVRTKAKPGISPILFVNFLLDQAVFIRLMEMHSHLPRFTERVHEIPLAPAQDKALFKMQEQFAKHRESVRPCRAWSAARSAFLRWPDKPWIDSYEIWDHTDDGQRVLAMVVPSLPHMEYPKERRLRRLVKRNMLRGRKTWIYTELTGENKVPQWDVMEYYAQYLRTYGIRVEVLRSDAGGGPKPEDREEWIAKTAPNVDVIISNPALVRTGLDLYEFPSIIFAYCGDVTYTLRQASRRGWRLGQVHDCEVDYLVYGLPTQQSKSVQGAALSLMAQKMAASLAIEGDFSGEGLAALSNTEDVASQLAKFIDGTLQGLDTARTAFEKYRAKLEACMPDLGKDLKPAATGPASPIVNAPVNAPAPDSPLPPEVEAILNELADEAPTPPQSAQEPEFSLLKSLDSGTRKPQQTEAERVFEQDSAPLGDESLAERKRRRLAALCQALDAQPFVVDGDIIHFKNLGRKPGVWLQLVSKRRSTVRERNFATFHVEHPNGWIAFVEPFGEEGPSSSSHHEVFEGVDYLVSMMPVADYMAGERKPGEPVAGAPVLT